MEEGLHIALASEKIFDIWGFPVTNSLLTTWIVMAGILLVAFIIGRKVSVVPGRIQSAVEMFFEYVLGLIEQTLGSRQLALRYFPFIVTIFIFIFIANTFNFLPIFGTIGLEHVSEGKSSLTPLFRPVNADLNTTLALAMISFLVIELSGILTLGLWKYGSKFINFSNGFIGFAVGLLEIIGNFARLISFSFRLFGAIFAGEILLMIVTLFVPYFLPVPLMAFEAFIGLLQAAVFAILTLAFIKIAIEEPHGSESHAVKTSH